MDEFTIKWLVDPAADDATGSWAVIDNADDGVVDRYDTPEEAQKAYPSAFVVR